MHALRALRKRVQRFRSRELPFILMYHRIAEVDCDPWGLSVRPDLFADQIEALTRSCAVVPLSWLAAKLSQGRTPRETAVVTFDDGYSDVLTNAKPVLERFNCPATVFLTTGAIGRSEEFWWDELSRLVLESSVLPSELEIELAGNPHRWHLVDAMANRNRDDRGESQERARATRQELHSALWGLLKPLDFASRRQALNELSVWAGAETGSQPPSRALDSTEVQQLAVPGFIDIGAHTVTHPSLPLLDPARRREEVERSRRACEELTGVSADAFAYPFGDLDNASVAAVREAGFSTACSTEHAAVRPRADLLRLPRLWVGNSYGTALLRRLRRGR